MSFPAGAVPQMLSGVSSLKCAKKTRPSGLELVGTHVITVVVRDNAGVNFR